MIPTKVILMYAGSFITLFAPWLIYIVKVKDIQVQLTGLIVGPEGVKLQRIVDTADMRITCLSVIVCAVIILAMINAKVSFIRGESNASAGLARFFRITHGILLILGCICANWEWDGRVLKRQLGSSHDSANWEFDGTVLKHQMGSSHDPANWEWDGKVIKRQTGS